MKSAVPFVVIVVLLVGGLGVWWLGQDAAAAPSSAGPRVVDGRGENRSEPEVADANRVDAGPDTMRIATPEPGRERPAGEPLDPTAAKVEPWLLRVDVVDQSGAPVVGAVVTLWEARRAQLPLGMDPRPRGNSYSGRHDEPVVDLPTDNLGTVQVPLDLECFVVAAAHDEAGSSGERTIWHSNAREAPVRIVLEREISLRGLVLRADGLPAVGAVVQARPNGGSSATIARGRAPDLEPATADVDGRFVLSPVHEGFAYSLSARLGEERSFHEWVTIRSSMPPEVVLSFPGAVTLRGVVVDDRGAPMPGATVRSWSEYRLDDPDQDPDDYEATRAETGEDGRFEIAVRQHRRYQLVASQDGFCASTPVWLAPTAVRPHLETVLALRRHAEIAGRVVRGDGSPFADVVVVAQPEQGEARSYSALPNRRDLYGRPEAAKTDGAGRFALAVHPETSWQLSARWVPDNYRLSVQVSGVRPGNTEVTIRVDDAAIAGCVVRGVVSPRGEAELSHYKIDIVNYEDGEARGSSQANAEIDGLRFTLAPLPLGRPFALRVSPKDNEGRNARNSGPYAPFVYGPFTPDSAELSIDVPMKPWGMLPVRVRNADGSPAIDLRVRGMSTVSVGFYPSPRPVDHTGAVVLERLVPGVATLTVFGEDGRLHEERVTIEPGRNPERVVRLPPAAKSGGGR